MSKSLLSVIVGVAALLGLIVVLTWPSGGGPQQPSDAGEQDAADSAGSADTGDAPASAGTPTSGPDAAFAIDPRSVRAITVTLPGGSAETVTRLGGGAWVYAAGDEPTESGWPVDGTRALAALAALERVEPVGSSDDGPGDDSAAAVFHLSDGLTVRLAFATSAVGGNVRIEGPGGAAVVRDRAVLALHSPGISGWRSQAPMPGVGPGRASRVTIDAGSAGRLSMSRQEGRWFLTSPVSARADANAADAVLRTIGGLRVHSFLDALPSGALGSRATTFTVERDERGGDAGVATSRTELRLGVPAPMGAGVRYAQTTLPDGSRHALAVRTTNLPAVRDLVMPGVLIDKSPAAIRPDDVHYVMVRAGDSDGGTSGYRRAVGGWVEMMADGGQRELGFAEAERVGAALSLLSQSAATPLPASDVGFRGLSNLRLLDVYEETAEVLSAGYTDDGRLAVRSGSVVWVYDRGTDAPALFLLPAFDGLAPAEERAEPVGSTTDSGAAK